MMLQPEGLLFQAFQPFKPFQALWSCFIRFDCVSGYPEIRRAGII